MATFGNAVTLMALLPVTLVPVSYFVFREQIGCHAIMEVLLASIGVALLFLA